MRLEEITPAMRRVTLSGEPLDGLPVEEPGEIITLIWPEPGQAMILPEVGWRFPPGVAERQHARNYTVRKWDAAAGELDIDFFLHGDLGLAARWGEQVTVGDSVGFAGPRVHWTGGDGFDWSLLVADETGLPALAAIAETLPAGERAICVVEVSAASEEQPIDSDAALEAHWLHRGERPPGTTTLLADTVRALDLPPGRGRAWGGCEAAAARVVRDHVKKDIGLAHAWVLGYWKHRTTAEWD